MSMLFKSAPVKAVWSVVQNVAGLIEPSFKNFYPGCISPDVVPTNRLPNFSSYASCTD